ncbi:MAG: hypothetical protein VX438_02790, partial [Planctomycetota bacterium]|nr:hypothetical protein [Planctomycetota bacterium]
MKNKFPSTAHLALALVSLIPLAVESHDEIPGPPQKQPIAIVGGTIYPIASPPIENGTLLFDKGKIVAVGKTVKLPPNTLKINIPGKKVFPSLFESHSQMGLIEIGAVNASDDRREIGNLNPNVKAQVAVNPDSEVIPVTRSNGVLLALTAPRGNLVAGKSAIIQLDGWTYEEMTVKAVAAMSLNWPPVPSPIPDISKSRKTDSLQRETDPLSTLEKLFDDTRAYSQALKSQAI